MKNSAEKAKRPFRIKESSEGGQKVAEFILNANDVLGTAKDTHIKTAKKKAFEAANAELEKEAITIRLNSKCEQIVISNDNGNILAVIKKTKYNKLGVPEEDLTPSDESAIDSSNIGFKMMQKLGWTGGGLGSKKDGRAEPISLDFGQNSRHGLGAKRSLFNEATGKIHKEYVKKLLTDYTNSNEMRDLRFISEFTQEQRAYFHR